MSEAKRRAMRFAVYVRELGADPVALRGTDYGTWAKELQRQYDNLREASGALASQAARVRGRAVIRKNGLHAALAEALIGPENKQAGDSLDAPLTATTPLASSAALALLVNQGVNRAEAGGPNASVCQRKYRHINFLTAMLHACRVASPGLHIYPCDVCDGLHVGHSPDDEQTYRTRSAKKRLRAIEKQLAAVESRAAELRRERHTLLAKQGTGTALAIMRRYLLRIDAWLARLEQNGGDRH